MNKIDLSDVDFLFAVRMNALDRLENVLRVIDYLNKISVTNIMLLEASKYNNGVLKELLSKNVKYFFIEDPDPIFHRTRYINNLLKLSTKHIVSIWDADVIIKQDQMHESVTFIRENKADFVYPYKDKFLDTSYLVRDEFIRTGDILTLTDNEGKMMPMHRPNPVGGCFFAKTEAYKNSGFENEKFYGWGREDGERINRWNILGYRVHRVNGPLYHLTHARDINSKMHSEYQESYKLNELERIAFMSKSDLEKEIATWND